LQQWQSLLRSNNDESKCLRNAQRVGLKAIYTALLILPIEPLLFAINALPKSLLIPTETRILGWFGYNAVVLSPCTIVRIVFLWRKLRIAQVTL
jgi:hypothetical protein